MSYNDRILFHLLRHFSMVNENAIQCLIDRGYSKALIDENLQIPGSKFHDFFATDIKSLMLQCGNIKETTSLRQNGYLHISYEFEELKFLKGIGTIGIVSLEALKLLTSSQPVLKKNRGHLLLHATVSKPPTTNFLRFRGPKRGPVMDRFFENRAQTRNSRTEQVPRPHPTLPQWI